jgi:hypothetical protein
LNKEVRLKDSLKIADSILFFHRNQFEIVRKRIDIPKFVHDLNSSLEKMNNESPNSLWGLSMPIDGYISITIHSAKKVNGKIEEVYCNQTLLIMVKFDNNGRVIKAYYSSSYCTRFKHFFISQTQPIIVTVLYPMIFFK